MGRYSSWGRHHAHTVQCFKSARFPHLVLLRGILGALVLPPDVRVATPTVDVAHDVLAGGERALLARSDVDVDDVVEKEGAAGAPSELQQQTTKLILS